MRTTVAFMTIRETFMHRYIMGFTMAGPALRNNHMPLLVTVHALQFAMFTRINLLETVLFFVTAAAERRWNILCQFGRNRGMGLMTLETVAVLHGIGMPVVTFQTGKPFSMARMALATLKLCMGGRNTFHLFTRSRVTAKTDGTQVFY